MPNLLSRCRGLWGLLGITVLWLGMGNAAWACTCGSVGPCVAHRHFGTVFLGTVLHIRTVDNEHRGPDGSVWQGGGHKVVTIQIEEDFSARFSVGRVVEVTTGMGGGDCGFRFKEGRRYVVDASEVEGALATGICSDTRAESESGLLLRNLRRGKGTLPPDVSGVVMLRSTKGDDLAAPPKPLAGVAVIATGVGGAVYAATTDAEGIYEFPLLPWSAYAVHVDLPKGLMSYDEGNTLAVALPFTNGRGGAGCELVLSAYSAGGLAGQLVDEHGNGVAGTIWVSDRPPYGSQQDATGAVSVVGADGSFRVTPLDDGVYWLTFTPGNQWSRQSFYPGSVSRESAASVTVDGGRVTEGLRWIVTP